MTQSADSWRHDSYLSGGNADYLDQQYELFLNNPAAVPEELRNYFSQWPRAGVAQHASIQKRFRNDALRGEVHAAATSTESSKQAAVDALIDSYRRYGHRQADLDPLQLHPPRGDERLSLQAHGLDQSDLSAMFLSRGVLPTAEASLESLIARLKQIYCQKVGFEVMHCTKQHEQDWLLQQIETEFVAQNPDPEHKMQLLTQLMQTEGLENYLDKRYVGQKRFSIEGLDSMVPLLKQILTSAASESVQAAVIGMAHRGRLNVMYNVVGMQANELFKEFEGKADYGYTSGDVKYHLGLSSDIDTGNGVIHGVLSFNPSHLEFINPVLMGTVRARQFATGSQRIAHDLGITIHGDAAFSGQGVVMESLNMSGLRAYNVGGMIRVIANNQVGFSTSNPHDMRSTEYCTDIGRMLDIPVLHVNADAVESVVAVAKLAFAYRQKFHKDIIIDLVGYRRHGHQEVDEPTATQPLMYKKIHQHPTALKQYADKLIAENICTAQDVAKLQTDLRQLLDDGGRTVKVTEPTGEEEKYAERWKSYDEDCINDVASTGVPLEDLQRLGQKLVTLPDGFELSKPVANIINARCKMANGEQLLDWGFAEMLAYASLLDAGVPVRFSGEDVRRGTFYHRHAFLFDKNTGDAFTPLLNISKSQASLQLYDSLLSETGALGFEYGYSLADPKSLVLWEAQYGDFANGAQVIIDQFISSAWQKWQRLSGLVMLLPHGNEGAGPEHTSARLERYLQLCAQKNMQICVPTTPAQMFHLLRRQVLRSCRIPLIVMTPKSLLRHKSAVSELSDLSSGGFKKIIIEPELKDPAQIKHVILCSGKVYFDLVAARTEKSITDIAIVRIEQLYPFPYNELEDVLRGYGHVDDIIWCQEESKNQGAWYVTRDRLLHCLVPGQKLRLISRPASASPAAGYRALHVQEQKLLLDAAMGDLTAEEELD